MEAVHGHGDGISIGDRVTEKLAGGRLSVSRDCGLHIEFEVLETDADDTPQPGAVQHHDLPIDGFLRLQPRNAQMSRELGDDLPQTSGLIAPARLPKTVGELIPGMPGQREQLMPQPKICETVQALHFLLLVRQPFAGPVTEKSVGIDRHIAPARADSLASKRNRPFANYKHRPCGRAQPDRALAVMMA